MFEFKIPITFLLDHNTSEVVIGGLSNLGYGHPELSIWAASDSAGTLVYFLYNTCK
jgi:hypothetical protein